MLSVICDTLEISLFDFFNENDDNQLKEDPLLSKIYQLTPKQKEALLSFLDTIIIK